MLITLDARSKMLRLSEPGKPFRVTATGGMNGTMIDLIPRSEHRDTDSIVLSHPPVVADIATIVLTADRQIDYDYTNESFVITMRNA